jgi:hypothetical protein
MHPMFVQLYLEADGDDRLAEQEGKRRAANRGRRARARMVTKSTRRDRDRRPPR